MKLTEMDNKILEALKRGEVLTLSKIDSKTRCTGIDGAAIKTIEGGTVGRLEQLGKIIVSESETNSNMVVYKLVVIPV